MDSSRNLKQVAKGGALFTLGTMIAYALKLVIGIIVIRYITKSEYGLITLGFVLANIAAVVANQGFRMGAPQLIARSRVAVLGSATTGEVAGNALMFTGLNSLLWASLFFFGAEAIVLYLDKPGLVPVLKAFAFIIPPLVLMQGLTAIFQGIRQARPKVLFEDTAVHIARLVLVGITILIGWQFQGILYAYLASIWVGFVLFAAYAVRNRKTAVRFSLNLSALPSMIMFCLPLLGVGLINRMTDWVGTLILGFAQSADEIALYMAPSRLVILLIVPMTALGFIYIPIATRLYANRNIEALKDLYASGTKWVSVFALPLAMYFIIDAQFVVTLFFGDKYLDSAVVLQISSLAYCVHSLAGPNIATLVSCGYPRFVFYGSVVAASVATPLSLALVPVHGAVGAAVATGTALIVSNVFASSFLARKTGVHPFSTAFLSTIAIICFATLSIHWWSGLGTTQNPFYHLLMLCLLYMVALVAPIVTRSMSEADIDIIEAFEMKFFNRSRYTGRIRAWVTGKD